MKALSEEQELFLPFLEEVPGAGHLRFAGILADAGEVYLLFLHVVAQPNVVEVRRDVDQSVAHNRVPVLRQHFIYKELKPADRVGKTNSKTLLVTINLQDLMRVCLHKNDLGQRCTLIKKK